MSAIKKSYEKYARDLKRLGLIDYDLRKDLSTGQKSRITKLTKEWGHVIRHPELFHIAQVKKDTEKVLKNSGYKVTPKGKAVIPLHEYDSAKIKKGAIEFRAGNLTEKTYLVGGKDFHKKLEGVARRRLKRNEMLTARIGNSAPFNTRFSRYADLYKYISAFMPNDENTTKAQIMGMLSIVKIEKGSRNAAKKEGTANRRSN